LGSTLFLIATSKDNLDRILAQNYFEGFVCDEETDGDWPFGKEELRHLLKLKEAYIQNITDQRNNSLNKTAPSKNDNIAPKPKKSWWKFWK